MVLQYHTWSERRLVVFPLFFLVGNELRETQIVFEVGQIGISRKHGIAGKALAGSCLEPLDSQVVLCMRA
jgi:hypothetical protein